MSDLPIKVYTSQSLLRNPARLMGEMLHDLAISRELAWRLFVRDTSAQYRQSILGYLWVFIPPLVAGLPFVFLNAQGVVKIADTPIPYAAFALIGTTIWQVFVDALNAPVKTVTAARPMLTRINLPREAILLSALMQVGLSVMVRLLLVVFVFMWFGLSLPATAPLFILGVLSLILAGFVAGLLLTPIGLLYNDVQLSLPILTTFLMFLTPVLYPTPQSGTAGTIAMLNPLTPLVSAPRDWLTLGTTAHAEGFVVVTCVLLALLICGWISFRVAMPHLIARIGN
jgi:lipopolysaccharide transport system permease protein